jgi:hypothetical protein
MKIFKADSIFCRFDMSIPYISRPILSSVDTTKEIDPKHRYFMIMCVAPLHSYTRSRNKKLPRLSKSDRFIANQKKNTKHLKKNRKFKLCISRIFTLMFNAPVTTKIHRYLKFLTYLSKAIFKHLITKN